MKSKTVTFNEEELKALDAICDAALKSEGVKMAMPVAYLIQKFASVPLTEPASEPPPKKPE